MERIFWLLLSFSVAACSCGSLRYLTNLSVSLSTGFSLFAGAVVFLVGHRCSRESKHDTFGIAAWLAMALLWKALLIFAVGTKGRTGLYSLNSQDVASHLAFMGGFIYKNGDAYHGFVGLYGLVGALVTFFHIGIVDALAIAIYGNLALSILLFTHAIVSVCRRGELRGFEISLVLIFTSVSFLCIDIPLFFYNIGEGFWAHITSVIVLAGLWAGYTVVTMSAARVAIALCAIALYRFSYGLNLGDLVVTVSALLFLETRHLNRCKVAMIVASLALFLVGGLCYRNLLPLGDLNGGIVAIDIRQSLFFSAVALAGIVASFMTSRSQGRDSRVTRFLLFPIIFCAVSMLAEFTYHQAGFPERYYSYKYGVHRVILLSMAAPVALVCMVSAARATLHRTPLKVAAYMAVAGIVLLGSKGVYECYKGYRLGLDIALTPPNRSFPDPLFSDQLVQSINEILAREGKSYHGTLARTWGGIMFLNVFMLHQKFGESTKEIAENMTMQGITPPPPSACAFWIRQGLFRTRPPLPLKELKQSMAAFEAREDKTCMRRKDHIGKSFTLCYVCGQDNEA